MTRPTLEQISSFQSAFDYFNSMLFDNLLPQVMLNFSRCGSKAFAFYAPKRWGKDAKDEDALDEISLNPIHLWRSLEEVFSSLVHEQCHLWQYTNGKPSRAGYHNKQWADKMLSIDLQPTDGNGKMTGQAVSHTIIDEGKFKKAFNRMPEAFSLPWRVFVETDKPKKKRKSGKRSKYTCPACNNNIWGKEGLNILCVDCNVHYKRFISKNFAFLQENMF